MLQLSRRMLQFIKFSFLLLALYGVEVYFILLLYFLPHTRNETRPT